MDYLHIKNLEAYHPGYKDRDLKWFKCYFKMVNADPEPIAQQDHSDACDRLQDCEAVKGGAVCTD